MAAGRSFRPKPSSEATLKCSRTVNCAVSGAKTQSSYGFNTDRIAAGQRGQPFGRGWDK